MFLPSALRVELWVRCDDDIWSHLGSTRSRHSLQRHLLILSVETVPVHLEILHWSLRSLRFVPATEGILGNRSLFLTILLYHLLLGMWIHLLFVISRLLVRWFFEDKFLMRATFPNLPNPQSEYLVSKFPPRPAHSQERSQVRLVYQIDEIMIDLVLKSGDIQPLLQKELLILLNVLQTVFHMEFSRLPGGLGHFADRYSIP